MSDTARGWYPDPYRRHQARYWDGGRWTEHVSDGGATAVDPTEWGAATSSEAATPPPAWRTPPANQPPTWGSPPPPAGRAPADTRDRVPAIVGLAAAAVLLVAAFLPWFQVSVEFGGLEASETVSGIDGSDGVLIIVLALIGGALALLRVLGKGVPQVGIGMAVVGLLATIVGLIDLGNDDPDSDTPLGGLAEVDPLVGLWLVILAGIAVAVAGVLVVLSGRSRPSPA